MSAIPAEPRVGFPSLVELLRWRAQYQGDRRAYVFLPDGETGEIELTYGELDRRARAIGALLQDLGASGERALLLYPAGLDYVAAFFGCLYAGTTAVPAYPPRARRSMPRIRTIVADAQATVVLTTRAIFDKLERQLGELPDLAALVWRATDATDPAPAAAWRDPQVTRDTLAFLQYTSGSTAAPKGVMVSHGNLLHNEELIRQACEHSGETPFVSWLPLYHDLGLIGNLIQSLYIGAPCTLMSPVSFLQRPMRWLEAVSRYRAHTSGGPNFAYDLCVRKIGPEERERLDLSSWQVAFNGAEPVRWETLERFAEAFAPCGFRREAFYPCYGMAETTLIASGGTKREKPVVESFQAGALERHRAVPAEGGGRAGVRPLVGCGRVLGDLRVTIADSESRRGCPPGRVGEIWVAGPSVCQGYWNRPEETAATFGAVSADTGEGPFLRTGDLGFLWRGELFITGRLKDLIIVRGQNHYPQDVEATVEKCHAALRPGCGAAFSIEAEGGGEELLVVVQEISRQERDPDVEEIAGAVRQALAEEHELALHALVLIQQGTLPKTTSGKIQRRKCRHDFQAGKLTAVAEWREGSAGDGAAPASGSTAEEVESWLVARLAARLGLDPADVDLRRSLLHYGLDSLAAIELAHEIETRFGVALDLERLFEGSTLAELAAGLGAPAAHGRGAAELTATPEPPSEAPLSQGQRALWFLHQLEPESPAYNIAGAVRIHGDLDATVLHRAFQTLVDRHACLRTTFAFVDGEPVQRIHRAYGVSFAVEDASPWAEQALAERLDELAYRPFDLERGPLFRVTLLTRSRPEADAERILVVAAHHIISDFWSLAVLIDELGEAFRAARDGRAAHLPFLPLRYTDYVRWHNEMLAGERGEELRRFWRARLDGELPTLELPTDRPRPRVLSTAGAALRLRLGRDVASALVSLSRRSDATLFVTLLAGFQALLHRVTGERRVLLGTPTAGRGQARLASLVGYFVNPVVLSSELAGDPRFTELAAAARRTAGAAFEHQEYPFANLVEQLQPVRDPSRSPVFQVMFALQTAPRLGESDLTPFALDLPGARVSVGDLVFESVTLAHRIAQFDLTLSMGESDGALSALLDYSCDLFDRSTVARLGKGLVTLFGAVAGDPERRLSQLPVLARSERQQLVVEWNDTAAPGLGWTSVHSLFEAQAARDPAALAVVFEGVRLTYGELEARAEELARRLRERGVGPESRVGLHVGRSLDLIVGIFGILKAGGAYVPLDPSYPESRLAWTLGDAGARVMVTRAGTEAPFLELVPEGIERVALDGSADGVGAPRAASPPPALAPGNAACVIYTSGSTGRPKGVVIGHGNLLRLIASFIDCYQAGAADRILPVTALASASFVGEILPVLCSGGAVILPNREQLLDFAAMMELISRHGVTILSSVPTVIAGLDSLHDELPKLRLILSGGEALPAGDVDALLEHAAVVNSYGMTEGTVCSTIHYLEPSDLTSDREVPIGRPLAEQSLYILDPRFRVQPIGCPGEIYVGGQCVARGYLGSPARTAAAFVPDPGTRGGRLYRTGDWGRWVARSQVEFLGRADQQVQIRGFRIELGEIESVLDWHPAVRQSAVVVRQDGDGERPGPKRIVAYVVFRRDAALPADELLGDLRQRLPDYMVPAAVVPMEALPLLPNGKVDQRALPVPAELRPDLAAAYAAPVSELERAIAGAYQEVLSVEKVGLNDNFFDLGGHSLLLARAHARLREILKRDLSLIDLFQYPTVSALAVHLGERTRREAPEIRPAPRPAARPEGHAAAEIAIVGLSGRFPGAKSVDELWRNLVEGIESIVFFTDEELEAEGIDPELIHDPNYVKAKGILGDVDRFDARFFGHNPRVAELMDPQHRVFLECAWEALENAGYDADRYPGRIGVFAGQSMNTYWLNNLYHHIDRVASVDSLEAAIGNDKDSLTTEVSYRMNLKGPSVNVQSSSSTSLTAIHYACQSLLHGECEMALAGGSSIHLPEKSGYFHHEGGTTSPDGHCRSFDARAEGFVSGHGVGVVVLKRLADARADGDQIVAVIKGSACNNDGSLKVSYMAPSVDGHAEVVVRAQRAAGVTADTIGYVEAHGTGTLMGDPIEVAALTQAFRQSTAERSFCALGSLKTNIGHLDTAAGVAGLIKAALCLRHKTIPAILHFEEPNPKIDFDASPFFVNDRLRPFEPRGGTPRRAGVSSLGMGGTNTHVVLEEAPAAAPSGPSRPHQLLVLSAKTATALETATAHLAEHLKRHDDLDLADAAYTLYVGRKRLPHRRMVVARDRADAAAALAGRDGERVLSGVCEEGHRGVVFLWSGQGSQYLDMGRELYEREAVFRAEIDRAAELLQATSEIWRDRDLRRLIYVDEATGEAAQALTRTAVAQPALFAVEYALARLWMSWGVAPQAMIGHSIGELAAACLAGVFTLGDALELVAVRGDLMQRMPPGAMLAVPLPEPEVTPLLGDELALAAVNRPDTCVVSGPEEAIAGLEGRLGERGVEGRRLHTSHAFHSPMMEPILEPFLAEVSKIELRPPRIPFLSNVTGTWIRADEATDPAYWARQLRGTVRFSDGVGELVQEPNRVFLEIGPGHALATAVRQHPGRSAGQLTVTSLRHPRERRSDVAFLLHTAGRLWLAGVEVDPAGFYAGEWRRRVALPTYPFERQRFWVEPAAPAAGRGRPRVSPHVDDWFYVPVWKQSAFAVPLRGAWAEEPARWLVFADDCGLGSRLAARLAAAGREVVTVTPGREYAAAGGGFTLRPGRPEDYDALVAALASPPDKILHLWSVTGETRAEPEEILERGFYSLLWLAQACGRRGAGDPRWREPMTLVAVSDQMHDLTGDERLSPAKATLLGPCRVMSREYPHVRCRSVDVAPGAAGTTDGLAEQILNETVIESSDLAVAYRGSRRWVQVFEAAHLNGGGATRLRERGVYLVTGGLGGLGLEVAEHLARTVKARLVLVGRSPLPEREQWDAWLTVHANGDPASRKIRRLKYLEELGGEVLAAAADVADPQAMAAVVAAAEERFGPIHGVVHAAGVPGGEVMQRKTRESAGRVLAPKVDGTLTLDRIFRDKPLDFWVLFSSTTSVLAEPGQADYAAANAFLDAFAHERWSRRGAWTAAVNWDAWREVGMAVATEVPEVLREWRQERLRRGLEPRQGIAAFARALGARYPQVVVSREDFVARLASHAEGHFAAALEDGGAPGGGHARPELASAYAAPESELEKRLAVIWEELLGLDQVGVNDNFFELGGNSLIGLKVAGRIKADLDVEVSPVALFDGPTVRSLARLLGGGGEVAEDVEEGAAGHNRGARRRARRERRHRPDGKPTREMSS